MVMVCHPLKRDLSHNPMRILKCSGSSFLLLWWCVLATYFLNLVRKLTQASGAWRGRSRCALPLLFLLFFSSFSFSSSIPGYSSFLGNVYTCHSTPLSACIAQCGSGGPASISSYGDCSCAGSGYYGSISTCYQSCSPSSSDTVVTASTWSEYFSNASYCDPSTDCVTSGISNNGSAFSVTNGSTCFPRTLSPASPTTSTSSVPSTAATPCPPGYSIYDASGCVCSNGSGSFVSINSAASDPSCNGGYSTAPTLSPVAPAYSNGVESCPSGSSSISNSSGTSCYVVTVPPKVSSASSGSVSNDGGSGGSSSFHDVPPVTNSSGQTVCPSGSSSISNSNGSGLTCVASGSASGSGTAPTSSGTSSTSSTGSGTSPTSSTGSGASPTVYPSSISMPTLATSSVVSTALGTIGTINETSSESCPSPVTFSLMNSTFSIPFTYACSLASRVRPLVIGVFSLASLLLIVK